MRPRALFVVAFVLVACAPRSGPSAPPGGGVRGQVLIGPVCPVEIAGHPCPDRPFQATIVAVAADGTEAARTKSGSDGRFELRLRPGSYRLTVVGLHGPEIGEPREVTVPDQGFAEVTLNVDSGIR